MSYFLTMAFGNIQKIGKKALIVESATGTLKIQNEFNYTKST